MRNIIILCTALLIAIAFLAGKYFTKLAGKNDNVTKVLSYIPADAALVLNFNNDESFYEIFKEYKLFDALIGKHRAAEIEQLKRVLNQAILKEITGDKKIFLSFHPSKDSIDFLYCMNLDNQYSTEELHSTLSEISDFKVNPSGNDIFKVTIKSVQKPFYLFLERGVAIVSFSDALLKRCVNEKEKHLSTLFINEINKAGNKNLSSPVNLFINHEVLSPFLSGIMIEKANGNSSLLSNLKGFSALSMNFKSDALMLNGLSNTDTTINSYLNLFLHQKPVPNHIKRILPENTSNFIAFGASDLPRFHSDLNVYFKKRGELQQLEDQLELIQRSTGVNPDRDIKPLFDKEFVSAENFYGEKFVVIKVLNGRNINFKLQLMSSPVDEIVGKLDYNHLFYYYFGEPLKKFPKPYFGVIDNYLVLANTPGIISNFISGYSSEHFLANTEGFKQYDQLVANQSNVLYFVHNKNSKRIIDATLKSGYASAFRDQNYDLKNFYGLSYQWTADGDHFFSNLYLSYNSTDSISLKGK